MQLSSHTETPDVLIIDFKENNLDASNVREFKENVQGLLTYESPPREVPDRAQTRRKAQPGWTDLAPEKRTPC